jgi:AcrR family transcriptional regulator
VNYDTTRPGPADPASPGKTSRLQQPPAGSTLPLVPLRPGRQIGPHLPGITEPAERADAARNRRRLLDAARELVREHGVDALTMDALAKRAGVGKGTVFRRFGNRTGLMYALLDHSESLAQEAFIFGPPPLGPGAPPVDRLIAFGRARLLDIEVEGELYRAAELGSPERHYSSQPYRVLRTHVAMLLREADTPGDSGLLTDALLSALAAGLILHQIRTLGYTREQIGDNWEALVRRVTGQLAQ